ncbi:MAG: sugar phosphate isomerase/epimerase [Alistipes sp.]|nr:sugar phosphate isomerase/epimerase [Alistipes sp.]
MNRSYLTSLLIGLSLLLGTVTASAQTVTHHRSEAMKIGVAGFNFREFNVDQSLKMIQKMGVKYLSVKDFHLPQNSTSEQIAAFKQKLADAGIEGYTLGPIYMNTEADVDRVFEYAKRYGAQMFIGVPAYDLLPYIDAKIKTYNIRMAIHTHGPDTKLFPDAADVMAHIADLDPRIGICLDLGHTTRFGASCVNDLKRYRARIFDIHIKDETAAEKKGQTCEMGRGVMDIPSIVKTLRKIGYTGVCSLEFEKDGKDPLPGMAESIGYLRGVCDATK